MSQQQSIPDAALRTMQIIALALPAGVILFAMVAVVGLGALSQPPEGTLISLIAAAFAAMAFVAHVVVPRLMFPSTASGTSRALPTSQGYAIYQTRMIIQLALLEGAAFFNLVALISEHNWWSLGITGLLVGWMLTYFPTRSRVERWLVEQGTGSRE